MTERDVLVEFAGIASQLCLQDLLPMSNGFTLILRES